MRKTLAYPETVHEVFELPENQRTHETAARARMRKAYSILRLIPKENRENATTRNVLNNLVMHFGKGI